MKNSAREALATAMAELESLQSDAAALMHRAQGFSEAANTQQPSEARLQELQASRPSLLGAVALGTADVSALDELDRAIVTATEQANAARRGAEIAAAGRDALLAQHAALHARIVELNNTLPALRHAAGIELVREALPAYREALQALGEAHARVAGAAAAVSHFADLTSDPRRLHVVGGMVQPSFVATLPALPDLKVEDWTFSIAESTKAAEAEALTALGVA